MEPAYMCSGRLHPSAAVGFCDDAHPLRTIDVDKVAVSVPVDIQRKSR